MLNYFSIVSKKVRTSSLTQTGDSSGRKECTDQGRVMKGIDPSEIFFLIRESPFGPFAIVWSVHVGEPRVCRILLSKPKLAVRKSLSKAFPTSGSSTCRDISELANRIEAFLQGSDVRFYLSSIRLDLCSHFQQQVLRVEYGIPRGCVSTYQRIAHHVGRSSGARAVGQALASNPFPLMIPCHRAIRTDRTLGGYQGGAAMKTALLEMEGVTFDDAGHLAAGSIFY